MPEIVWEDPPASGRGLRRDWAAILAPLFDQPKRWAKIEHCKGESTAASTARRIRRREVTLPAGQREAVSRRSPDGGSDLYVRYMGES